MAQEALDLLEGLIANRDQNCVEMLVEASLVLDVLCHRHHAVRIAGMVNIITMKNKKIQSLIQKKLCLLSSSSEL
ncbi:MAG TPA: hypothetical protein PKD72_01550 [Gemmatales bacterium]|nr:hypothetical protein [Gemmatales bacterium]